MPYSLKLDSDWFSRKRILLAALFISLCILGAVVYWFAVQNKWLIAEYHKQNEMSAEQDKLEDLFLDMQIAESAIRAFAGSEDTGFIGNFQSRINAIRTNNSQLRRYQDLEHSSINPALFSKLDLLIKEKVDFMQQMKKLCEWKDFTTARSLLGTEKSRLLSDSILALHHTANSLMQHSLKQSKKIFNLENNKYYTRAYSGIVICMLVIIIIFYLLIRGIIKVESIGNELMLQKEHLRITLTSIGDGLITTDNDGKVIYMNPAAEHLTGWKNQEVKDMPLQAVYDVMNGETGQPFENLVTQIIAQGKTVELENNTILRTKNAGPKMISTSGSPLMDLEGNVLGAVLVFNDITERKRNEEKVKKAIERYEILSRATSDTIWDWDIRHDSILYNDNITEMFGYPKPEIENGASWWKKNLHPDDYEHISNILDQAFKKGEQTIQFEYRYRCADHSYKYILDRAFVVYGANGMPLRMIGAMQDITNEKEHERRVSMAITDAQEKERRELGMELHDNVNQLLGATLLYLGSTIKSGKLDEAETNSLKSCVAYIHEAIQDLRNLSHRLTPYTREEVSLKKVIEMLIEPMQKTKQFDITLQVDPFEDGAVDSDIQTNLYRIVQEQLTNILKHAAASEVKIQVKLMKRSIRLHVADNGKGFDPASAKAGIGIENIKRRAEMFSGKCKFKTSPGNGCELVVELPLKNNPEKKKDRIPLTANQ